MRNGYRVLSVHVDGGNIQRELDDQGTKSLSLKATKNKDVDKVVQIFQADQRKPEDPKGLSLKMDGDVAALNLMLPNHALLARPLLAG